MTWWRWPAALLVDTPHGPLATVDGVVWAVLIDPGTEARSLAAWRGWDSKRRMQQHFVF
jgi:hypothetical protein